MIIIDFVSSKYGDISTVRGEILQNFVFFLQMFMAMGSQEVLKTYHPFCMQIF